MMIEDVGSKVVVVATTATDQHSTPNPIAILPQLDLLDERGVSCPCLIVGVSMGGGGREQNSNVKHQSGLDHEQFDQRCPLLPRKVNESIDFQVHPFRERIYIT